MAALAETEVTPTTDTPVLLRRDEAGIATLTLNRPQARNALSVGLMARLQEALEAIDDDAAVRVVVIAGAGPAFCAGHDLREMRADPGRDALRGALRPMQPADADDRPPAEAGHRPGARRRHRGRLPARRHLRSRRRRRGGALRHARRQYRPLLLDADGGAERAVGRKAAMEMLLTGDLDRCRAGARARPRQPRRRRRPSSTPRSTALARQIAGKSAAHPRDRQGGVLSPGRAAASPKPMPMPRRS